MMSTGNDQFYNLLPIPSFKRIHKHKTNFKNLSNLSNLTKCSYRQVRNDILIKISKERFSDLSYSVILLSILVLTGKCF